MDNGEAEELRDEADVWDVDASSLGDFASDMEQTKRESRSDS